MTCGIYKITNLINGHCYIGQSFNIEERWRKEKQRAFQTTSSAYNSILSRAFRKYGFENFQFEILQECSQSELDELEQYYIQKYNSYFNGYNATLGGQFNGGFGNSIKINKNELLEIYDLLQNSNISQKEIAKRYGVGQDVISTINTGKSRRLPNYNYPLRQNKKIPVQRKSNKPNRIELKNLIRNKPFSQIGKIFGVSDNAVRKWCDSYGLPRKKQDIKLYSDEDWEMI